MSLFLITVFPMYLWALLRPCSLTYSPLACITGLICAHVKDLSRYPTTAPQTLTLLFNCTSASLYTHHTFTSPHLRISSPYEQQPHLPSYNYIHPLTPPTRPHAISLQHNPPALTPLRPEYHRISPNTPARHLQTGSLAPSRPDPPCITPPIPTQNAHPSANHSLHTPQIHGVCI